MSLILGIYKLITLECLQRENERESAKLNNIKSAAKTEKREIVWETKGT